MGFPCSPARGRGRGRRGEGEGEGEGRRLGLELGREGGELDPVASIPPALRGNVKIYIEID